MKVNMNVVGIVRSVKLLGKDEYSKCLPELKSVLLEMPTKDAVATLLHIAALESAPIATETVHSLHAIPRGSWTAKGWRARYRADQVLREMYKINSDAQLAVAYIKSIGI